MSKEITVEQLAREGLRARMEEFSSWEFYKKWHKDIWVRICELASSDVPKPIYIWPGDEWHNHKKATQIVKAAKLLGGHYDGAKRFIKRTDKYYNKILGEEV